MTDPGRRRVSYSQLTTFRSCPQQWFYKFDQRLRKNDPDQLRAERDFGLWWHALRAADSIERGVGAGSLVYAPALLHPTEDARDDVPTGGHGHVVAEVYHSARVWWERLGTDLRDAWVERLGGSLPDRLAHLDCRWHDEWADERAHEHPLAVELGWSRDLPRTPEGEDTGTTLVGYVDEVLMRTDRNMVVVRDHKTHRALTTSSTADDLMDSQLPFYAWGAAPRLKELGVFDPVRATAYDRVRTTAASTPVVTTAGNLSKAVSDYDVTTYREWAAGPDGKGVPWHGPKIPKKDEYKPGGVYQLEPDVVERLSTPAERSIWFQRTLRPLSSYLVRAHLRAAMDSAIDLERQRARAQRERELPRNTSKSCQWCDYSSLCLAQLVGGADGEYDLAQHRLEVGRKR